jgi:hypothetical protein
MTTQELPASALATDGPVLVHADHALVKELGDWTTARRFDVRIRYGQAMLDLRSAGIPAGDIEISLNAERGLLRLLVADDAVIHSAGLRWSGRGQLKDNLRPAGQHPAGPHPAGQGGRVITITGAVRKGEIRVHRGGTAIWASMFSRGQLRRMHRAHQQAELAARS